MAPIIELRNVSKSFDRKEILRSVNLKVEQEETKIILGGSGQGKSTLLRLMLGLEIPDEGEIFIDNKEITSLDEEALVSIRKKMGMVFQESSLFDSLTVFDNIAYRLEEDRRPEEEIVKTTKHFLHMVDLAEEDLIKLPEQLSGGMKRRVAIARAMVGVHNIMLYDEPTAGLDPITASHITSLMIRLRDLEKTTSVVVTQDLISSYKMVTHCAHKGPNGIQVSQNPDHPCAKKTRLLMLKDGQILVEGRLDELQRSQNPYVQEFFSSLKLLATR